MKRRAKGEGSLFYSETLTRWVGQITLPNGKKRTKYGKTQGEVKKWMLEQRKAVQDNNYLSDENITLDSFLTRYIEDVATNTLAPRTLLSYKSLIKNHISPDLGNIKISKLRPEQLQALYTKKLNDGLSRRTVQYIHQFLHTVLQVAYKWGLVLRNVVDLADAPASDKKTPIILTVSQVNDLLTFVRHERLYALYACAVSMGMREGELLGLEWSDINFETKILSVNKQLQYIPGNGLSVKTPKTKSSIRPIPIPDVALNALKELKQQATGSVVFVTENGTYYSPRNILRHFQQTLGKMGLPRIPFHNLRHSCASYHLAVGTNPKIVQALLGHSSITVTLNTYSHLLPGVSEEATRNINRIFT